MHLRPNLVLKKTLLKRLSTNSTAENEAEKRALESIDQTVKGNPLVVFMKGTADRPQCGFSRTVIEILKLYPRLPRFTTVNVLADESIRSAIKKYSEWPTVPQLFVKGDFVGGCDIVYSMYKNGELAKLFESKDLFEESRDGKDSKD